ncbi:F-actin-capping protein subunit beta [Ceratobasidium sp. 428]|nr:F-actin-capping protein subunit beta [Ceratobasidium sp. 428]
MILSFSFPNRLARRHKRVLALLTIIPPLVLLPGSLSQFWPISKAALHSFRSDTISSSTQVTSSNHNKNPSVIRLSGHQRIEGGRLRVSLGGTHPFHDLIADAEVRWNNMLESQSATLDAAIKVYQHRYGRRPPVGFDKWYEFARSVNFKLIDEFDQINRDISPLLALPNRVLQQRLDLVSKESHSYHLAVKHGKTSIAGPLARWEIPARLQNLVSDFAEDLPDLTIYVSGHDVGPTILGEDMRIAVDAVLRSGQRTFALVLKS